MLASSQSARAGAIGPEAVRDMQGDPTQRVEVILIDADGNSPAPRRAADAYRREASVVFGCWSLSRRRCRDEVLRVQAAGHDKAYYLTGTPREWVAAGIAMQDLPPARLAANLGTLASVGVADLASALKDGTEFTLVDVRSGLDDKAARIEGAIAMPPVVLSEKRQMLPKNGWIVLYDGGDGAAEAAAAELRAAGFPMAVALAGGFPAWVTSEQR